MEIFFQKVGNTQGRTSKFVKHNDGTTEFFSIWKAKQDQIKREEKAVKREAKAVMIEKNKTEKKEIKLQKQIEKANIVKPIKVKKVKVVSEEIETATTLEIADPNLDIDTATCSDEDFDKFIGAHKKAIKIRKFAPIYS